MKKTKIYLLVLAVIFANFAILLPRASASTLTKTSILELGGASNVSPMIASTGQSFALDFKTVGAGATSATVNFNNFSGGSVNTTQSISSTGCTTYFPSATLLPGSLTAAGSGTTITISSITALSATTEYCTVLTSTSAVTNPALGVYSALVTVGSDSQTAGFDVLTSGANAYSITGTVGQTFTLSLSGSTDSFGSNLSASALTASTGITATVSTNAASGWSLYAKDANAGLTSATAGHTIATVSPGSNVTMNGGALGTEKYALGVSANNTTNYAYNAGTTGGGLSNTAFNQVATNASSGTGVTQVLHELADISATTQPGADYTDTITVIGTGSF